MELTGANQVSAPIGKTVPGMWVDQHADYLYSYALGRVKDEQDARDLVQDVFLAALQNLRGFNGTSSERTWLTAILRNKIVDMYRKKSSAISAGIGGGGTDLSNDFFNESDGHWKSAFQPSVFTRSPDDGITEKEFNKVLGQCLDKLPALWMAVFTMKHVDGAESQLICEELRLTSSNFWVIIHRAKLNLRQCLQKNWL